jgi:hypothetical protein
MMLTMSLPVGAQHVSFAAPAAGKELKIASTNDIVIPLNNALGSGAGNVGSQDWKVKAGITVIEAWYTVNDNIPDFMKFGAIDVRPSTAHTDTVTISFHGIGVPAIVRLRVYALYTE